MFFLSTLCKQNVGNYLICNISTVFLPRMKKKLKVKDVNRFKPSGTKNLFVCTVLRCFNRPCNLIKEVWKNNYLVILTYRVLIINNKELKISWLAWKQKSYLFFAEKNSYCCLEPRKNRIVQLILNNICQFMKWKWSIQNIEGTFVTSIENFASHYWWTSLNLPLFTFSSQQKYMANEID